MTLGLHEDRRRRKRKRRWTLLRWLLILIAIGAAGVYAYDTGKKLAEFELDRVREDLAEARERVQALEQERAELQVELDRQKLALADAEVRYQRDVPQGVVADLLAIARQKLEIGVSEERLAFLLEAAREERDCSGDPETKRFLVTTPLSGGGNNAVRFGDGRVTVTASGESATNAAGQPEAWFDPAKPVTLRFTDLEGAGIEATGLLPMTRSLVAGNREFRFTATAGQRGFIEVTGDSCAYP